jgi:hypothetical protein
MVLILLRKALSWSIRDQPGLQLHPDPWQYAQSYIVKLGVQSDFVELNRDRSKKVIHTNT